MAEWYLGKVEMEESLCEDSSGDRELEGLAGLGDHFRSEGMDDSDILPGESSELGGEGLKPREKVGLFAAVLLL